MHLKYIYITVLRGLLATTLEQWHNRQTSSSNMVAFASKVDPLHQRILHIFPYVIFERSGIPVVFPKIYRKTTRIQIYHEIQENSSLRIGTRNAHMTMTGSSFAQPVMWLGGTYCHIVKLTIESLSHY